MCNTEKQSPQQTLHSVYEYVKGSLSFVEAKNGSLVIFNTAIILGILQASQSSCSFWDKDSTCFLVTTATLFISLMIALFSFMPLRASKDKSHKKKEKSKNDKRPNIYSTEGLTDLGKEAFAKFLLKGESDDALTSADYDLLECTMHTARVSSRKYKLFRIALIFSISGVLLILLLILF